VEQQLGEAHRRVSELEQHAAGLEQQVADAHRRASELEQHAGGLEPQLADARRRADEAEQRAAAAEQRIGDAERKAADAERDAAEAMTRQRQEIDGQLQRQIDEQVAQAVASARRGAELESESARRRAQDELMAERARSQAALDAARADAEAAQAEADAVRAELEAELTAARDTTAAAPMAAAGVSPTAGAGFDRVLHALREIDNAPSLSQTLQAVLEHARSAAGRAAIFLVDGERLKAWKSAGLADADVQTVESSIGARDLLARAIQSGRATRSRGDLPAPPFARLPPDRSGVAVPLLVGGRAVAVLYADSGMDAAPPAALHIVETLARHASAALALRTAMRTLEISGGGRPAEPGAVGTGGTVDPGGDEQGARRFARLLVSEIKLYNEAAVHAGRQGRDLLARLRTEIDRARRLYEERVSPAVGARHVYFQQELVQTLADGDPSLLGAP